jgi:hypothetical protein
MARGFNALRAALGAVTGVAEGLQQRELLAAQKEKERKAFERQEKLDAQSLAMQLAGLQAQGWKTGEQIAAPQAEARKAISDLAFSAMPTASGVAPATPATKSGIDALSRGYAAPQRSITMGGQKLVLPETEDEARERTTMAAVLRAAEKDKAERGRVTDLVENARKGGRNSRAAAELLATNPDAYNRIYPEAPRLTAGQMADERKEKSEAEAWFNSLRGTKTPEAYEAMQTFDKLRQGNAKAPARELILATYRASKGRAEMDYTRAQTKKATEQAAGGMGGMLGAFSAPVSPQDKIAMQAALWDKIKSENPTMDDDAITARVRQEIP